MLAESATKSVANHQVACGATGDLIGDMAMVSILMFCPLDFDLGVCCQLRLFVMTGIEVVLRTRLPWRWILLRLLQARKLAAPLAKQTFALSWRRTALTILPPLRIENKSL